MVICEEYSINPYIHRRGSDELNSTNCSLALRSSQPTHAVENNNDIAKRPRLDKATAVNGNAEIVPSRVLHLRYSDSSIKEWHILQLIFTFGKVTKILNNSQKKHAFIEFETIEKAKEVTDYFRQNPHKAKILEHEVGFEFSHNKAVRYPESRAAYSQSAVDLYNQLFSPEQKTVIHITAGSKMNHYPLLTLPVLHQFYYHCGKILRMVTFQKGGTEQAMIEFEDLNQAAAAIMLTNIADQQWHVPFTAKYSNQPAPLTIKNNSEKHWDFTKELTNGDAVHEPQPRPVPPPALTPFPVAYTNGNHAESYNGMIQPVGGRPPQHYPFYPAYLPYGHMGQPIPMQYGPPIPMIHMSQQSTMVLVSNLDERVTTDCLFILFGVYGDIQRIKIFFNNRSNAIVHMITREGYNNAIKYLDRVPLYGKIIKCTNSKAYQVALPKQELAENNLTKDFSHSPLHRFRKANSKNHQNIYAPSSTLHLSNIPSTTTEEDIIQAFNSKGYKVVQFKFFPKDKKMALIKLESLEVAIHALIDMHNHQLSESSHLRVSFSKSNI